jgi:predicted nucleic acid-binding protein
MSALIDTPIWSLALRRRPPWLGSEPRDLIAEWLQLVREGRAAPLGIVRQEVLSGIRDELQFRRLLGTLRALADTPVVRDDYEQAAACSNRCRARGTQGSAIDYLICAVSIRLSIPIFTTDAGFATCARHLPIASHGVRRGEGGSVAVPSG